MKAQKLLLLAISLMMGLLFTACGDQATQVTPAIPSTTSKGFVSYYTPREIRYMNRGDTTSLTISLSDASIVHGNLNFTTDGDFNLSISDLPKEFTLFKDSGYYVAKKGQHEEFILIWANNSPIGKDNSKIEFVPANVVDSDLKNKTILGLNESKTFNIDGIEFKVTNKLTPTTTSEVQPNDFVIVDVKGETFTLKPQESLYYLFNNKWVKVISFSLQRIKDIDIRLPNNEVEMLTK